jgi:hypothetical protein
MVLQTPENSGSWRQSLSEESLLRTGNRVQQRLPLRVVVPELLERLPEFRDLFEKIPIWKPAAYGALAELSLHPQLCGSSVACLSG